MFYLSLSTKWTLVGERAKQKTTKQPRTIFDHSGPGSVVLSVELYELDLVKNVSIAASNRPTDRPSAFKVTHFLYLASLQNGAAFLSTSRSLARFG